MNNSAMQDVCNEIREWRREAAAEIRKNREIVRLIDELRAVSGEPTQLANMRIDACIAIEDARRDAPKLDAEWLGEWVQELKEGIAYRDWRAESLPCGHQDHLMACNDDDRRRIKGARAVISWLDAGGVQA